MLLQRNSKIHGYGIFTDISIEEGEKFYAIPLEKTTGMPRPRWARLGDIFVYDKVVLAYVNHSCSPNSCIDIAGHSLIAIRNIRANEEITCDYNLTESEGVKVPCNCGSENCRGYFLKEE